MIDRDFVKTLCEGCSKVEICVRAHSTHKAGSKGQIARREFHVCEKCVRDIVHEFDLRKVRL